MGLLDFLGEPLSWSETKKYADHVREHGITQFLHIYENNKDRDGDVLKWGDEVEYMLVRFDHENRKVRLLLRGGEIREKLIEKEKQNPDNSDILWQKEFTNYMLEGMPGKPYEGSMSNLVEVEANMALRREEVQGHLCENETMMSLTVFPRLGCPCFTFPEYDINGPDNNPVTRSLFIPDQVLSSHPRHILQTTNIRKRRGKKVVANVPIFKDKNTPSPFIEKLDDAEADEVAKPDHIYMDSTVFGMGNCCLQFTMQACNIDEARRLYDELVAISPFMLALSAASPIFRGYLSDVDARWNSNCESCDDRTDEERGVKPLEKDRFVIKKSRYGSVESYLSVGTEEYSDVKLVVDEKVKSRLQNSGIDEVLAQHIAHLWIRDPITLYSKTLNFDDKVSSYQFENMQSSIWQSVRFKPPPPKSSIGWRVEFRVCDVQLTDFENAAFAVFVVLLTRVLLTCNLTFLVPISLVEENMNEANKRDAARKGKFWFKRSFLKSFCPKNGSHAFKNTNGINKILQNGKMKENFEQISLNSIINGKDGDFPGFIPIIRHYLDNVEVDIATLSSISDYLTLISKKASGECLTTAQWIREFICSHPEYKKDSVVNDSMTYELLWKCDHIAKGVVDCPRLFCKTNLGNFKVNEKQKKCKEM